MAVGVGSPPPRGRKPNFENVAPGGDRTIFKFSTFRLGAAGAANWLFSQRCCPCDAVSPVADPRGRRRGRNFENVKKGRGPTVFKVFRVSPPAGLAGIETWKTGKGRWHPDFLSFLNFASGPWAGGETLINKLKTVAAPPFSKCSKFRPGQEPAPGGPTLKTSKRTNKTIIV